MPYLDAILGPRVSNGAWDYEVDDFDAVPPYVFRVMSEEHFQQSFREGSHQSDQRNCYIGQKATDPQGWGDEEAPNEGTVAGRWVYIGYIPHAACGLARIVKIEARPEDGWRVHPWDEEGGYIHTYQDVPVERFVGWSEPFAVKGWRPIGDGSARVHLDASGYPTLNRSPQASHSLGAGA